MTVTLDVSQLRGWLKADACCRGSQAQGARCGAGCGPGEAGDGARSRSDRGLHAAGRGEGCATADIRGDGPWRSGPCCCCMLLLFTSNLQNTASRRREPRPAGAAWACRVEFPHLEIDTRIQYTPLRPARGCSRRATREGRGGALATRHHFSAFPFLSFLLSLFSFSTFLIFPRL